MPIVVTRDGLRTEGQLADEIKPRLQTKCLCGEIMDVAIQPQGTRFNCPHCDMEWIW